LVEHRCQVINYVDPWIGAQPGQELAVLSPVDLQDDWPMRGGIRRPGGYRNMRGHAADAGSPGRPNATNWADSSMSRGSWSAAARSA
jgi:hypothetical protein